MKYYKVTAWKNGSNGYGIRVRKKDYMNIENWRRILVGRERVERQGKGGKKRSFTIRCPEIRSMAIKKFLSKNKRDHWVKGNPPELTLCSLGNGEFKLKLK